MNPLLFYLFLAYTCCLALSIAGMELFFGIHVFLTLILLLSRKLTLAPLTTPELRKLFWSSIILGILYAVLIFASLSKHPEQSLISETLIIARDAKFFFVFAWAMLTAAYLGDRFQKTFFRVFPMLLTVIAVYGVCQAIWPMDLFSFFRQDSAPVIIRRHFGEHHVLATIGAFSFHLTYGNIFILYFALLLLASIRLFLSQQPQFKYLLIATGLVGISLMTTFSRNVWINVAVLVLCMGIYYLRKKILPILAICAFAGALFVFGHPLARDFVFRAFDPATDYQEFGLRLRNWQVQWTMFREYPWLGIGHRQNEKFYEDYRQKLFTPSDSRPHVGGHAHNTFLQILVADGLLGLMIWIVFIFLLIRFFFKNRWQSPWYGAPAGLWLLLAFFIAGLTENALGDAEVAHNVFALLGMAAAFSTTPQN